MKILTLEIDNFMTIGHAKIELNDRGLLLIQGENLDDTSANSNGSGKTTLLDALCWVFYGSTSAGHKSDTVINRTIGDNCRVKVCLDDDGQEYAVMRHRKHKTHKNHVNVFNAAGEITLGTDKLTDALIEKIVGSSKDVFLASVYASQDNFISLPDLPDRALKEIVEEAAGITRLTDAYLAACRQYNTQANVTDNERSSLSPLVAQEKLLTDDIEDLQNRSKQWAQQQEELAVGLALTLSEHTTQLETLEAEKATLFPLKALTDKIATLKISLKDVTEKEHIAKAAESALNASQFEQKSALSDAKREKAKYIAATNEANATIDQAGKPCSECGKPYELSELEAIKQKKLMLAKPFAQAAIEAKKAADALNATIETQQATLLTAKADIPDVSVTLTKISKLETLCEGVKACNVRIERTQAAITQTQTELDALGSAIDPYVSQITTKESALTTCISNISIKKRSIDQAESKLFLFDAARAVFAPKGVRNHILTAVTPFLNERTAHYLGTLSDGNLHAIWQTTDITKKGEIRDKFVITATNNLGASFFGALSGGEKRKVRLATALALQDLVASRAVKNIELFIGDEIDNALDTAGLERLMGILTEKARERGTVMVISHQELKSWITDVITVVKENGLSTLH